ncbi:MAG TPA: hypothetical protein VHO03_08900 [Ignavibacteriales bacterium]|nr:hypothetical protein [Ignavibacteriales bacterium]
MMSKTVLTLPFFCIILGSCSTIEPDLGLNLNVSLLDATCSEIRLKVSSEAGSKITYKRDEQPIETIQLSNTDTILTNNYLTPNKTYTFEFLASDDSKSVIKKFNASTLDTTSHNMTWNTYTFGNRTSALYDISIVNENDIWAVGEIYTNDSLGNYDNQPYNAVHWDGSKWTLLRIMVNSFGTLKGYYPLRSVYALSSDNVWFCTAADLIRWDGKKFESKAFFMLKAPYEWQVNRIWGKDENNIYCVGYNGALFHYKGKEWEKIETGTNSDLLDIYGEGDNIFIAGSNSFKPSVLLRLKNGEVTKIIDNPHPLALMILNYISGPVFSVWLKGMRLFTLTRFNLYMSDIETKGEGQELWAGRPQDLHASVLRGNDVNDIFTSNVGENSIMHYNGSTWHKFDELSDSRDRLTKIAVKKNIVAAAGYRYDNGIERYGLIYLGHR